MSHIKFQGYQSIGSREADFYMVFFLSTGMTTMFVKWPGPFEQVLVPSSPDGSTLNLATIGPVASEEILEISILWQSWSKS